MEVRTEPGRWDGAWCALASLAAMLLARPFVETGLIDDFSYVKTAWVFAQTGHLIYNGWATAMLGWQIVWGGLFAKIFGPTYTAVRLSTMVTAMGCVALMQALARRFGLTRRNAVFAALMLGLSPLFLPMAISFMSDVSGVFVVLLTLWCCVRALQAEGERKAVGWLIAVGLLGAAGGTARQIAWMAPLLMVPSTAWLLRRRVRGVVAVAAVLCVVTLAAMVCSVRWFAHQPYNVPEALLQGPLHVRLLRELAGNLTAAAMCAVLLLVPVLVAWLVPLRKFRLKHWFWIIVDTGLVTLAVRALSFHGRERGWAPWTEDVLNKMGLMDYTNAWFLGVSPGPIGLRGRVVLSVLAVGVLVVWVYVMGWIRAGANRRPSLADGEAAGGDGAPAGVVLEARKNRAGISWWSLVVLCGPFVLAYVGLLAPRGMWANILDRYLLPLVAIAVLLLLRLYQDYAGYKLPAVSFAVLAVYAAFAICGTHDWCAWHRARLTALNQVRASGVAVTAVEAGYEIDGMTQIDAAGAVVDERVKYPAGVETKTYAPAGLPAACKELFNPHTPMVRAKYLLAFQVQPCTVLSEFAPVEYGAWMPPFRREVLVLKLQY